MKKKFLVGVIVTFVVAILLCKWAGIAVLSMLYTVPVCAIVGGGLWAFFSWLADVMPFLESFSENSGWFVNFLWTYVGKPLFFSVLSSYIIISMIGFKPKESEPETEETGIYLQFSDEKILVLAPDNTFEYTFVL
ncbi:MAG: hypothetical protein J6Y75_04180 [Spirochaetaceae bacterium]|nr:hypothetical protein [Spirochaetaceae bacterium]